MQLFLLSGTIGVPTDLFLLSADLPSLQTVKNPTLSDCAENVQHNGKENHRAYVLLGASQRRITSSRNRTSFKTRELNFSLFIFKKKAVKSNVSWTILYTTILFSRDLAVKNLNVNLFKYKYKAIISS